MEGKAAKFTSEVTHPMSLNPYLYFDGQCEEAFKFYEKRLGGKITFMMTWELCVRRNLPRRDAIATNSEIRGLVCVLVLRRVQFTNPLEVPFGFCRVIHLAIDLRQLQMRRSRQLVSVVNLDHALVYFLGWLELVRHHIRLAKFQQCFQHIGL